MTRKEVRRVGVVLAVLVLVEVGAPSGRAEDRVATLTLAAPSFVSLQNEAMQPIPAGTIRFRMGEQASDGSIPFQIETGDVDTPPFPIGRDARAKYELAAATSA